MLRTGCILNCIQALNYFFFILNETEIHIQKNMNTNHI